MPSAKSDGSVLSDPKVSSFREQVPEIPNFKHGLGPVSVQPRAQYYASEGLLRRRLDDARTEASG